MAKHLSIFGTSSDAGKSTLAFALTYLLHQQGFKVAPFKAQNVSNNSCVCDRGGEIAQPQFFAAESIGIETTALMNPILLKSGKEGHASLIINGYAQDEQSVSEYYDTIDSLKPIVKEAFEELTLEYETIVAEGAGSPVELNLMDKDLSNIYIAQEFKTKIILVADIEKGGVFASIWGVYNLLPPNLKENVIGVIINKFRGDITLFDKGVEIIEKEFGLKVLGIIPYKPLNLGFEDSQSLMNYTQNRPWRSQSDVSLEYRPQTKINVAVIKFPHISNFTDFEPLINDEEVLVSFIDSFSHLHNFDLIILPGSKRTMADLKWLKEMGFEEAVRAYEGKVLGICGGYEMMFHSLLDEPGVEEEPLRKERGLGYIEGTLCFNEHKTLAKGRYEQFGLELHGYEIHHGQASAPYFHYKNIYGTFIHGLFDNDNFRYFLFSDISTAYKGYNFTDFKANKIASYCAFINDNLSLKAIIREIK